MKSQTIQPAGRVTINKLMAHKGTKQGSRLYHKGAYYRVTGTGGTGIAEHWVCAIDLNQDHVEPPK